MTKQYTVKPLDLRLFDGDGGASPAAEGTGMSDENTADNAQSANGRTNEHDAGANGSDSVADSDAEKRRAEFDAYINGEGKQFYDEKLKEIEANAKKTAQKAFNKRFAENKVLETNAKVLEPLLQSLAEKYGADAKDTNAIVSAYFNDESLYEERARENGVSVEVQKKFDNIERQNAMLRQQQQEQENENRRQQLLHDWGGQIEEFKSIVPDFDFDAACENPKFYNLMAQRWDVKSAYAAAFNEEYDKAISSKAEKRVTDNIRARGMRTNENGTSQNAATPSKVDVTKLTASQIEEYIKRSRRGEEITFR